MSEETTFQDLARKFAADRNLSFSTRKKEDRFIRQFCEVALAMPECEGREALVQHVELHLLRSCAAPKDYCIDVEEAVEAWPQYSQQRVVAWGNEEIDSTSSCGVSASESSTDSSKSEVSIAKAISEGCDGENHDPKNPFNLFQQFTARLKLPRGTVSQMYTIWKVQQEDGSCSFEQEVLKKSMREFLQRHLGVAKVCRQVKATPPEVATFQQLIVELEGLTFTKPKHEKALLIDFVALLHASPQYESLDSIVERFVSNLESTSCDDPKSNCRFTLESVVWSNWAPGALENTYTFLSESQPKESKNKRSRFNWFQHELARRQLRLSKPTVRALYAIFRSNTASLTIDQLPEKMDSFVKERFKNFR